MIKINYESLPYFGKINSISRIVKVDNENGKYYLVKRYDAKGNEKRENFEIPINTKNTKGLIEDYSRDLKDYLIKNESRYIDYRQRKRVFKFDLSDKALKLFKKIALAGICLSGLVIATNLYVISLPIVFYIGTGILVASSVGCVVAEDIEKEMDQVNFVRDYDNYTKKLNEYGIYFNDKGLEKINELTEYKGLSEEKNKGNSLKLRRELKPIIKGI